ncbi:LpxL/LpxP family Kdo(2)-lipid IV(A) lauroyl/palmitoleoyl acyltransferase [Solilutibacter silvestris]|uniref:Lipid A biosynthesis acyltransferase n=1 Tax=Solilutibacter silvestris TaxID=1645665 RepID=A0A2K1Q0D1_9GAMM|nr:LpxL/LpxP family Kdo(2)-lipid IV(A) lauroyl/palmitoleoyl acyltransferase [Lysobacter silvestris]PNS08491.1 lipid A biosynthesis lauroyl (or palmitoleoyl) acyltransferase [Lysobacter silvestris]
MVAPTSPRFHLKDLPAQLGVACLRGLARLPWGLQRAVGRGLGWLLMWLLPARRRAARTNIELCFPELDEQARATLLRESFRDLGIGVFEFARAWWGNVDAMRATVTIEGVEKLRALQAQGRGILLVSGHFMTLELCGRLMCDHVPLAGMYRRYRSPAMEDAVMQGRLRYASAMYPNDDIRGAIRHLKKGGVLWYAPDQDMRGKDTVYAPFFGIPASTINATHQLARLTGCAVVPFFHRRVGDRYVLRVGDPLDPFPSDDTVTDATAVNAAIEAMVREAPTQYLWIHRRFKRQPDGASLYAR